MLPILFSIGPVKIYTFGVFLVLAFFWGSFLLWKLIRLTAFKEEEVFDGLFLSLGFSLFFGRLFYVALNFSDFGFSLLKFILINGYPGLSLYGILFGGFLGLFIFSLFKKLKFFLLIDYFIPPLFLALAFGKLGSFFSGAELGTKTKFFLATKFAGFDGTRHLTPFYESLLFFLGCYLTYKLLFLIRKDKLFLGFLFYFFFWFFSLTYFLFDKIKEDHLYFFGLSFNLMVSKIILLTTTGYFLYYFRKPIVINLKKYGQSLFARVYQFTKKKIRGRS
jgi:phosphatidylglycerol---prolipoprotein diacylglyceryl transferase